MPEQPLRFAIRQHPDGYWVAENLHSRRALRFATLDEARLYVRYEGGSVVSVTGNAHEAP